MTKIYLIRHAEAEGNLYRRVHGHYDSLITVRGQKQIKALEKRFAEIPIDYVYSSDLIRTRVTAGAIYKSHGLELQLSSQLREVNMGVWEDQTWGEVERFEPEQLEAFNKDPSIWKIDGCEDYFSLQNRMKNAVRDIALRHDGKTVAVVSHGSAIRTLICGILNIPPQEIRRVPHCDNTAVALLHVDGSKFTVEFQGDNSHLTEETSTFAHQRWWRENTTFDSTNLRFVPFDLTNGSDRYMEYRMDAWEMMNGNTLPIRERWLNDAKKCAQVHSRAVSLALLSDTPAGMIELDIQNNESEKAGVIGFFYMEGKYRRTGIAVQLLGQAVSVYRSLGREKLRMTVNVKNEQTIAFCNRYGFSQIDDFTDRHEKQLVFEMDIALR